MSKISPTEQLLNVIIDQELALSEYAEKLPPLIEKHFLVLKKVNGYTGTINSPEELVDRVIRWENGEHNESLELTLQHEFHIAIKEEYLKKKGAKNG